MHFSLNLVLFCVLVNWWQKNMPQKHKGTKFHKKNSIINGIISENIYRNNINIDL